MDELVQRDAEEFGAHHRAGGWRLALLVARNVKKYPEGRPPKNSSRDELFPRISAKAFADAANEGEPKGTKAKPNPRRISDRTVGAYLDAWEKAAEAGKVPAADTLYPGDEPPLPSVEEWDAFYVARPGGYNGGTERTPTQKQATEVLAALPPKQAAQVITAALNTEEVVAAIEEDETATDQMMEATVKLATRSPVGKGPKVPTRKPNRGFEEMSVTLQLMAVLGAIRNLAKENADSPLIIECKSLMRETLDILDAIQEASDPDAVEAMFSDFDKLLSEQK